MASGGGGTPHRVAGIRLAHLTTIDLSLALLLRGELEVDTTIGLETFGLSAPGRALAEHGVDVTHVAIPHLTRSWRPLDDARAAVDLWRALRRLRLDVLHTHNPKTGVLGRVIGKLAGVPVVVNTCHGLWATEQDALLKRAFVLGVEGIAAQFSDAELFQNPEDRQAMARFLRPGRAEVVGNGTELDRFSFDRDGRYRLRRVLGINDGEVAVGVVGRVVPEKGLLEYAEAAARLRGRARFFWIGPDDAARGGAVLGRPRGVEFLGMRRDMRAVYSALDVFVLPSHREGFPRSAMEAAASGLPLVLSDIRGCREIGRPGSEACLVPTRDGPALAAALETLVTEPALRRRLGESAYRRSRHAFDQRDVAIRSLRTYARVARRKELPWAATLERAVDLYVAGLEAARSPGTQPERSGRWDEGPAIDAP